MLCSRPRPKSWGVLYRMSAVDVGDHVGAVALHRAGQWIADGSALRVGNEAGGERDERDPAVGADPHAVVHVPHVQLSGIGDPPHDRRRDVEPLRRVVPEIGGRLPADIEPVEQTVSIADEASACSERAAIGVPSSDAQRGVVDWLGRRLLEHEVHRAADGVAAVQHRGRPLQDLEPIDVRELGVDPIAFVPDAVDHHDRVAEAAENVGLVHAVGGVGGH